MLCFSLSDDGREPGYPGPTGWAEAVACLRLPQNVACRFPSLRSSGVGSQHYLSAIRSSPVSMVGGSSLCIDGRIPLCMEAMLPSNNSTPLAASPCGRLSRPRSTMNQSDCRRAFGPFSPFRLGGSYKLSLEPDGSPLFTRNLWTACRRYEPRKHLKTLARTRHETRPSPVRDKVGYFYHDRFRG